MSNCPTKTTASGSSKKKSKNEAFVWTDDEVDLLLSVVLEYKIAKTSENFDWETCQSKYADILDLFISQYPSAENAIQLDKEFPHQENELTKAILTSKMKAIRSKFRAAIDSGRKSGHGRVVLLFFDKCQEIWGGSPATTTLQNGIETSQISDEQELDLSFSSPSSSSTPNSQPYQQNIPTTRSISPLSRESETSNEHECLEVDDEQDPTLKDSSSLKERRDLLNNRLKSYRQDKLKRKLSVDAQLLNIAKEDMEMKKRIFSKMDDIDRQQGENMKRLTSNMEQLTGSIVEGFAMLRQVMQQPPAMSSQFVPPVHYQSGIYNRMPNHYQTNRIRENETFNNDYEQNLHFQPDNF